jgi:hypothetical protein
MASFMTKRPPSQQWEIVLRAAEIGHRKVLLLLSFKLLGVWPVHVGTPDLLQRLQVSRCTLCQVIPPEEVILTRNDAYPRMANDLDGQSIRCSGPGKIFLAKVVQESVLAELLDQAR